MGIDLSYWKSAPGVELDPKGVYQRQRSYHR